MDFTRDGDSINSGGGNLASGIALGSMMNRRDDDRGTYIWAVIIFAIIFIIAIIALAMMFKEKPYERLNYAHAPSTDIAALLTPLIAAKSMESNHGNYRNSELDRHEIMLKLEASEDRARQTQTQQEIGALSKEFAAMGFGLAGKIDQVEKKQLETYAKIENQLGMQGQALQQILTTQNNSAIINGVIQQLCGMPRCAAG